MKIMSDKKFRELMNKKDIEHVNDINEIHDRYDSTIERLCDENRSLRRINNNMKSQLNGLESHKVRYLRMIENKSFKSKRIKKKYSDKLVREIKLLLVGGESNEF